MSGTVDRMPCPECGESIPVLAKHCRFCQAIISEKDRPESNHVATLTSNRVNPRTKHRSLRPRREAPPVTAEQRGLAIAALVVAIILSVSVLPVFLIVSFHELVLGFLPLAAITASFGWAGRRSAMGVAALALCGITIAESLAAFGYSRWKERRNELVRLDREENDRLRMNAAAKLENERRKTLEVERQKAEAEASIARANAQKQHAINAEQRRQEQEREFARQEAFRKKEAEQFARQEAEMRIAMEERAAETKRLQQEQQRALQLESERNAKEQARQAQLQYVQTQDRIKKIELEIAELQKIRAPDFTAQISSTQRYIKAYQNEIEQFSRSPNYADIVNEQQSKLNRAQQDLDRYLRDQQEGAAKAQQAKFLIEKLTIELQALRQQLPANAPAARVVKPWTTIDVPKDERFKPPEE
jgi:hypothetical protein